jgi:hypothetical protein
MWLQGTYPEPRLYMRHLATYTAAAPRMDASSFTMRGLSAACLGFRCS